jgi:hypothetical protein
MEQPWSKSLTTSRPRRTAVRDSGTAIQQNVVLSHSARLIFVVIILADVLLEPFRLSRSVDRVMPYARACAPRQNMLQI